MFRNFACVLVVNPWDSNHGSFYFNQLASLQILIGDMSGANATLKKYFTGIYQGQINQNGDQVSVLLRLRWRFSC